MAIFPEQGREATGKRFAFDFASGLGKMVNELVQMCAIGNDVCALSNTTVGTFKGYAVNDLCSRRGYLEDPHGLFQIRQLTPDMDFGGLHDGALRKHPFKEHEFILRTEKY